MHGTESRLGGAVIDVAVEGGALRVETLGAGPPLLFVHGWTLDRRVWAPQAEAFAQDYQVVAFDRRGFGDSTAPADLAREPDDLLRIADRLALERIALVAMSQGARPALAFAIRHPDRVCALALQGAPLPGDRSEALPAAEMAALVRTGDLGGMRRLWRAHPMMRLEGAAANAHLDAIVADYAARDLLDPVGELPLAVEDLARIEAPVIAITGGAEPEARRRAADRLAEATRGTRVDIPGASHLCNLCHADAYNEALAAFLATSLCAA